MGQGRAGFTPLDVQLHLAAGGTVKDARSLSLSPTTRPERERHFRDRCIRLDCREMQKNFRKLGSARR
jgi:hypothetical protein